MNAASPENTDDSTARRFGPPSPKGMTHWVLLVLAAATLAVGVLYAAAASGPAEAKDNAAASRSKSLEPSVAKRGSPDTAVTRKVTREEAKRALKYWTQKRMANATPVSSETDRPGSKGKADQPLPRNSSSRPAKGAAPVLPSEHNNNGSRRAEGTGFTPYQAFGLEWTGPSTRPPATVNGVLFYRLAGSSKDRRCSASTVNSPPENLVFTAGSCVHRGYGDNWTTNVMFVPGYRNGSAPYGKWVAKELWSNSAWTNSGDIGYNYGAVVFFPNASGQRLVNVVGANGIAFNYPAEQDTYTFGYPPNYANGEVLHYCSGRSGSRGIFDPRRLYIKCDFEVYYPKYNARGGPWVMDFDGELGYLHSITTSGQSDENFGVIFDDSVLSLYNAVRVRF